MHFRRAVPGLLDPRLQSLGWEGLGASNETAGAAPPPALAAGPGLLLCIKRLQPWHILRTFMQSHVLVPQQLSHLPIPIGFLFPAMRRQRRGDAKK